MRQQTGKKLAGALARGPMERVSPGVYRNAKGQLTGPGGRPMPNQSQGVGQRIGNQVQGQPMGNMAQNVGQQLGNQMQLKPMPWSGIPRGPQMDPGYFDTSIGMMQQQPQNIDPGFYNPSMNQINQQQLQQMQQYPSQYQLMQKMGRM